MRGADAGHPRSCQAVRERASGQPFSFTWRGKQSALRALRPMRCYATNGPLPLPASPRPCRGSPSTEGLARPDRSVGPRHAWSRRWPLPLLPSGERACLWAAFFIYLAREAKCAARASPHALLRNEWAPPFACLSPPLSGQPLNRGACSPRQIRRSTPCVEQTRFAPYGCPAVLRYPISPAAGWPCAAAAAVRHPYPVHLMAADRAALPCCRNWSICRATCQRKPTMDCPIPPRSQFLSCLAHPQLNSATPRRTGSTHARHPH